jgi:hypothetical protein
LFIEQTSTNRELFKVQSVESFINFDESPVNRIQIIS